MHPVFRAGLTSAAERISHEGAAPYAGDGQIYEASAEGATLAVVTAGTGGIIQRACHRQAPNPVARVGLDVFCQTIEDMPMQEAAEHGAIYALHRLRDWQTPLPVRGILTPGNAGPIFALPIRLIRDIATAYQAATGVSFDWNFHDRPFSTRWLGLSKAEKLAHIAPLVARFRATMGLGERDLEVHEIDKHDRLVVTFSDLVRFDRKPQLLMDLEQDIRRRTGERIELFLDVVKDRNQLRRL